MTEKKDLEKKSERNFKRARKLTKLQRKQLRYERKILPILTRDFDEPYILTVIRDDFNIFKSRVPRLNTIFRNPEKVEGCVTHIYEKKLKHNHLGLYVNIKEKNGSKSRIYLSPKLTASLKKRNFPYSDYINTFMGERNIYSNIKQTDKYFYPLDYVFSEEEQEQYKGIYRFNEDGTINKTLRLKNYEIDIYDFKIKYGYAPIDAMSDDDYNNYNEDNESEDESDN